jgi:benzoyl-CoA reductase/2-hydroxyglutaryl-CoA dehydratase subunit BcrC/BadD/HgdB
VTSGPGTALGAAEALGRLADSYRDRYAAARAHRAGGGRVVGCIGADVPVELVTAVGALPVRLAGHPAADPEPAVRYLGGGFDGPALHVLADLLAGRVPIDLLLVSHDCEASLQLFYAIRELRRLGLEPQLPETHLVDVLHLPHATTARYNLTRLHELAGLLERWSGRRIDAEALARAVAVHDEIRATWRELRSLRTGARPQVRGTDALRIIGAATALPAESYLPLLRALLDDAGSLPAADGRRIFLTGSSHDTDDVYRRLEDDGLLVVGEDHDWGDALAEPDVGEPTLERIAERYQLRTPTAATGGLAQRRDGTVRGVERTGADALVGYVRDGDDAPLWDFAVQARAVGVPAVLVDGQRYGAVEVDRVRSALPGRVGAGDRG